MVDQVVLDNHTSTVAALPAPRDTEITRARGVEILAGDLFEVSLASLLFLVQYEAINGWLTVARRGVVTMTRGHISSARCGLLRGHEGLRELHVHRGEHFSIVRGELEGTEGPVRRGEYTAAHDLLTQALALRPDDRVVQQNLRALVQRLRQP